MYTVEEKLKYAASQKFQLLDQDILNKLCEGSVRYLDMAWNMMVDYAGIRKNQIVVKAPAWLNEMYLEARKKPKIIQALKNHGIIRRWILEKRFGIMLERLLIMKSWFGIWLYIRFGKQKRNVSGVGKLWEESDVLRSMG